MPAQVKPWCCPCHGESNWVGRKPYTEEKTEDKKLTQAQKTPTLAWCYCVISQHRQLKHHACVLKKDPTHEVDGVAAHNHHGSQYRRDSTQSSRFYTPLCEAVGKEEQWISLIGPHPCPFLNANNYNSRRSEQKTPTEASFPEWKTWGTENGNHSERAQQLY